MANKMLIDATHPEETRVVVVRGNRVEEFDFESANRRQLRGNIYLAKVTRVEPSLQAAFVDYGGNRHGFLAFSEIHPDYYQIPVADRQALIAEEERAHRAAEDEVDRRAGRRNEHRSASRRDHARHARHAPVEPVADEADEAGEAPPASDHDAALASPAEDHAPASEPWLAPEAPAEASDSVAAPAPEEIATPDAAEAPHDEAQPEAPAEAEADEPQEAEPVEAAGESASEGNGEAAARGEDVEVDEEEIVESVGGGDAMEEVPERMPRLRRQYKIQEVIKRRQIMLVQVVKEERGTKGAALTTYLSLAGRYSVLMPNTARGGGISRKITSAQDRKRLKSVAEELEVPDGMGVILRTAGANRTKAEIKRDFEYLIRLWETVRDLTLKSTAPTLVYEEGSLIKRSIRDLYNKDIDEVVVAGEEAHREAKEFMRMLMPSHAKNVKPYRDTQPIFTRYGIESQLDAMFSPTVQLRSGGYVVLNQTEALVSIDVNSGRATREHHIEDTALKTNLEAAEEIARQLRLRDLAGLIVIDFIDMDEKRNNRAVERRLKECLKHDRARIQVGRISHFGLLEMSRQRIRTGVLESSTEKCPYCGGTGHMRSVSSVALQLLRSLEEMLIKGATHNLVVRTRAEVAIYVLNHKRAHLRDLEQRFRVTITINADAAIAGQQSFVIDKGEQVHTLEAARAIAIQPTTVLPEHEEETAEEVEETEIEEEEEADTEGEAAEFEPRPDTMQGEPRPEEHGDGGRRRRRRRRRGGRREGGEPYEAAPRPEHAFAGQRDERGNEDHGRPREAAGEAYGDGDHRRRRRGRRGGRRRRGPEGERFEAAPSFEPELDSAVADFDRPAAPPPAYAEPAPDEPPAPQPPAAHAESPAAQAEPSAAQAEAPPAQPEPPRRRSTVREPAPFFLGDDRPPESASEPPRPAPAAEPAASNPAPESAGPTPDSADPNQPRRSGWWSRRFAGGKG
ncbi:MAG TPA: Rne/Rng family ribonuclease [Xanthobacteraceae bacterium]|jgi:ribonuclease E|nr:Rne/Rng family ribonuclease [Xanthobacteraceae bacterium]